MMASLAWIALLCTLLGCRGETPQQSPPDDKSRPALTKSTTAEEGPVRVKVEVAPLPVRLSDEPTLTVTIDYEQGVTIEKPPFGESVGDFVILDFPASPLQVVGDREVVRQIYTLEPTRTGELSIWPVTVRFTDNRPGGDGQQQTIETEGLTVKVTSMLESDAPSLADLKDAAGPLELPPPRSYVVWWLLGIGAVLAGVTGVVLLVWAGRRRAELLRPPTPQELAQQELKQILEQRLAEKDVKKFYVELTGLVRRYIERTTGIHAPEQTTEEFLHEISDRADFPLVESRRLQRFLQSADLVKFAGHEPRQEDIAESTDRARAFIGISWNPDQELAA